MSETAQRFGKSFLEAASMMDTFLSLQKVYSDALARISLLPLETFDRATRNAPYKPRPATERRFAPIEETVPVGEEKLYVEKRIVEGGATRVIRTVVALPVEQHVELLTQRVIVERRRPSAASAPADVLSDRVIEMVETTEQPVVSKRVDLVEEVVLRREISTRVETIRDTVKRDRVAVEYPNRRLPVLAARSEVVRADERPRQYTQTPSNFDAQQRNGRDNTDNTTEQQETAGRQQPTEQARASE